VALDVNISNELKQEGLSRELISIIQGLRKQKGFEVTDRINVNLGKADFLHEAVNNNLSYICAEILADTILFNNQLTQGEEVETEGTKILIAINKI